MCLHLAAVPTRPTLLPYTPTRPLCAQEFAILLYLSLLGFPETSLQGGLWGRHLWKEGQGSRRAQRETVAWDSGPKSVSVDAPWQEVPGQAAP